LTWITFIAANIVSLLTRLLSGGLPGKVTKIFDRFHAVTSIAWLVFLETHLVLHQKWIVSAIPCCLPIGSATNIKLHKERQS